MRIVTGKNVKGVIHYHESKISSGSAVCIEASGFLRDVALLTTEDKIKRLENRNLLNRRAKTNTMHISLNFDPSESFTDHQLVSISKEYMKGIGFEEQPYLLYKHIDAAHPHVHLVSTIIKADGTRIATHQLAKKISEPVRKDIERKFHLVAASHGKRQLKGILMPGYGASPTKHMIDETVGIIMNTYLYNSFNSFQILLKIYGVVAMPVHQNLGLLYSLCDSDGKPRGVPIKASALKCHATFKKIRQLCNRNISKQDVYKSNLINKIEAARLHFKQGWAKSLEDSKVLVVWHKSSEGQIYGVSFIDHEQRVVFKGSDLGKMYSASSLLNKVIKDDKETIQIDFVKPLKVIDLHQILGPLLRSEGGQYAGEDQLQYFRHRQKKKKKKS
ncbi:relaxase/mobilization nuclease domain-containing protein [Fulvivirga ligni]|uniref:relaxase/mobilization nuclease domain-containing protein n=1 Tax=Fulvivirga ligni TaxID=2904246 RepID=UPI001F3F392B|nr:relaxase/mobilization nuclease domain-containing protein [Fulvivirga ligni]UII20811.1 relaxase/mobilization nuclease domain-containing protein [Fulvivirga ligni]